MILVILKMHIIFFIICKEKLRKKNKLTLIFISVFSAKSSMHKCPWLTILLSKTSNKHLILSQWSSKESWLLYDDMQWLSLVNVAVFKTGVIETSTGSYCWCKACFSYKKGKLDLMSKILKKYINTSKSSFLFHNT